MIEVINEKGMRLCASSRKEIIRRRLPYGMWTCAGDRKVLFDRDYIPRWQSINGVVSKPDPTERVPWIDQDWFYRDDTPYKDREAVSKLALEEFGGSVDDILWDIFQEAKQWDSRSRRCYACRNFIFEKIIYGFLACSHSFCSPMCAENHRKICAKGLVDAVVSHP